MKLQFVIEAVDKATDRLRGITRSVDATMNRIAAPVQRVRASLNGLVQASGLDRVKASLGALQDRANGVSGWASSVVGGIAAIGAAAGAAGWALKGQINQVDAMLDQSKKLKVGIEQFQRLGYAAQLNGSSQEEMGTALQFLSQNIAEAVGGSKEAQLWFARMGIPLAQLKKMNAVQVFEGIADTFHRVGDAGQNAEKKIAATRALMGRGGAELIQVLDMGSAGLKKFYAEADRLGAVVKSDAAEAMADFNDEFDRASIGLRGVMRTVASGLLPAFTEIAKRTQAWASENRELIASRVVEFVEALLPRLPAIATSLGQIAAGLGTVIALADAFAQSLGGWETVFAVVTGIILGKGLVALWGLASALWGVGAALLATPFGWAIAAVAGLAAGAALLIKFWTPVKTFFAGLIDGIASAFDRLERLLPNWMPRLPDVGADGRIVAPRARPGAALPSVAGAAAGSAALSGAQGLGPRRAEVGGTLKIEFDGNGQPRVSKLAKAPGSVLDYEVHLGTVMVGS